MLRTISNLAVLALIVAGVYFFWTGEFGSASMDQMMNHAEKSCVDEVRSRYDTTTVKANSVRENANGFVVKVTLTLARGKIARATCLTNHKGSVTDVTVYEY
jgi:thioredoxin reductase